MSLEFTSDEVKF